MPNSTTSTLIAICVVGVLVFLVPVITLTKRNENVAQENANLIVEEYATDIMNTGVLSMAKYQDFVNRLAATGNTYDIELEIQYLDENPGKKTEQANYTKIGENVYYSEYTTQILDKMNAAPDKTITLEPGCIIYVGIKNADSTSHQNLLSSFLKFSNAGQTAISASSSGMVNVNGVK